MPRKSKSKQMYTSKAFDTGNLPAGTELVATHDPGPDFLWKQQDFILPSGNTLIVRIYDEVTWNAWVNVGPQMNETSIYKAIREFEKGAR